MMIRNRPNPEGRALGKVIAKWCDDAEPVARLKMPALPPRCNSCACRPGDHVANGSPTTQMDFLKCIMEGVPFYCHEPAREGVLCSGWSMFMLAMADDAVFHPVEWGFSDEGAAADARSDFIAAAGAGANAIPAGGAVAIRRPEMPGGSAD